MRLLKHGWMDGKADERWKDGWMNMVGSKEGQTDGKLDG